MEQIKQIPYGVSDFRSVIEQNLYYVDKSMYIEELERQSRTLIFIRPRRFGKSLFLNMMRLYYDKAAAGDFERLFGGLYIGQHPTPLRNHYQVLSLDFSQIGGNIKQLEEKFNSYLTVCLDGFAHKYAADYPDYFLDEYFKQSDSNDKLVYITRMAKEFQIPLYLIIDEYDNFTNVVLNEQGEEVYHAITHADGFYRDLFKKFKGNFERIFLTGVSPVTLDDLTSGFNIGWNASTQPELDKMLGFSTADVRDMFLYYKSVGMLPANCDIEDMIEDMRPWYDNYCFAEDCLGDGNTVFNCDMVLYYLRHYVNSGRAPKEMLDNNTRTDYSKLKKLIQLDKLDGNRKGVLMKVIEEGQIVADLRTSFSAMDMTYPEVFPSLLFYYGMLTITGSYGSQLILGIPNNNVRKQYYSYLIENYENACDVRQSKLKTYFTKMAFDGNWREALQYMADCYRNQSSVRDSIEGERNIQGFFLAYLNLNDYYLTAPEVEVQHGYCDFFLLPNLTHYKSEHSYILEVKYLPKKDFDAKAESQWQQAVEQINGYASAPRVEVLRQGTRLHKIIMQFCGWELVRMEEVI